MTLHGHLRVWALVSITFSIAAMCPVLGGDIVVPAERANRIATVGYEASSVPSLIKPEKTMLAEAAYMAFTLNPKLTANEWKQQVEEAKAKHYDRWFPGMPSETGIGAELLDSSLASVGTLIGGKAQVGFALMTQLFKAYRTLGEWVHPEKSILKKYFTQQAAFDWQENFGERSAAMAYENWEYRVGVAWTTGYDPMKPWYERCEASPLPAIRELATHRDTANNLVISPEQLKSLFKSVTAEMNQMSADVLGEVKTLAAQQGVLYEYMTDINRRLADEEKAQRQAAERQLKIDAANSSVYILSTLVGLDNPELGHQMQVVGSSAVQIAAAINSFAAGNALQNLALSGNILSAAMNVVSLFGNQGPSPDQMILQELAVIKQMINQVRVEMHERFDRVDKSLNQIYQTLNQRFDLIDLQLGVLHGDVNEIQTELFALHMDLNRLEAKLYAYLNAGFRRPIIEKLNFVAGYRDAYGELIPHTDFIAAENAFQTWATITSKDPLSSGSEGRGYEDSQVFVELTSQPLESNLNWLNQFISLRFGPAGVSPFSTVHLANPHDWAFGANAYLALATESPTEFRKVNTNRLEAIHQVGREITRAMTNITLISGSNGPVANRALWAALIDYYRTKGFALKQALSAKEREYRLTISNDSSKQTPLDNLDLWGAASQTTSWMPNISQLSPWPGASVQGLTVAVEMPTGWADMLPPVSRLAELLGVASHSVGYSDINSMDQHFVEMPNEISVYSPSIRQQMGSFQIVILAQLGDRLVYKNRYLAPRTNIVANTHPAQWWHILKEPYHWIEEPNVSWVWSETFDLEWKGGDNVKYGWRSVPYLYRVPTSAKSAFMANSQPIDAETVSRNISELVFEVNMSLRAFQRGSYSHISNSLNQASTLQSAAQQLTGAKLLLDSFIGLGFCYSLESDDILRSLLYGTERIVDTDVVKELCQLGIARSYDTNQNAKVDIAAILDRRIAALETWITNRLEQIEQSKQAEPLRSVTTMLSWIRGFQAVQQTPVVQPVLRMPKGMGIFEIFGEPNVPYRVQSSVDLKSWTTAATNAWNGTVISEPLSSASKFYRTVVQP